MKTLITSTALVLFASAAAAQVSFSGYGRFGLGYQENPGTTALPGGGTVQNEEVRLISRFRLNIDGKAVTDSGVEFSARVRLQADDRPDINEQSGATLNGARFSAVYSGFRLDVGNVAGVFDDSDAYFGVEPGLEEFTGQYAGVDYSFLEYTSTGAGANAVAAYYQTGDFYFGASYDPDVAGGNDRWDVGLQYSFADRYSAFLAYGENETDQSLLVAALTADYDQFSVNLFLGDEDLNLAAGAPETDGLVYGVSGSYDIGAATSLLFSYGSGEGDADAESYALGFDHDLGGGVALRGAVAMQGPKNGNSDFVGDFGVYFKF